MNRRLFENDDSLTLPSIGMENSRRTKSDLISIRDKIKNGDYRSVQTVDLYKTRHNIRNH